MDEIIDEIEEFYSNINACISLTPKAEYSYLPLIPRLRLLYANKTYSAKIRYPQRTLEANPWENGVRDVWEGEARRNGKKLVHSHFSPNIEC